MKKLLVSATMFAALTIGAFAQDMPRITPQPLSPIPGVPVVQEPKGQSNLSVVPTDFFWDSYTVQRFEETGSPVRQDLLVPVKFTGDTTEFRGYGEIFNPAVFYTYFNSYLYNESSGLLQSKYPEITNDQEYIDQLKGVKKYTISAIEFPVFKNSNVAQSTMGGKIEVFKTTASLTSTGTSGYKARGFQAQKSQMTKLATINLDPAAMDTTLREDNGNFFVNPTVVTFDTPLQLKSTESVVALFSAADDVPALSQPVQETDEFFRAIAYNEYREGSLADETQDNPIDSFRTFGVVYFHFFFPSVNQSADWVLSAWSNLVFGDRNAIIDVGTRFFGTVETQSGVVYEYNRAARGEGLGAATPNPTNTDARVPFSITKPSHVKIDLFGANGELIKTLVDEHYQTTGNYAVDVPATGLNSGVYMVRMVAGDKVYSTQLSVAH